MRAWLAFVLTAACGGSDAPAVDAAVPAPDAGAPDAADALEWPNAESAASSDPWLPENIPPSAAPTTRRPC